MIQRRQLGHIGFRLELGEHGALGRGHYDIGGQFNTTTLHCMGTEVRVF